MISHSKTNECYGWCGRILKVDLSTASVSELDTMAYSDLFLGGRGIASRLYWELIKPETGALDPDNHLMFMTGPLGATGAQGLRGLAWLANPP